VTQLALMFGIALGTLSVFAVVVGLVGLEIPIQSFVVHDMRILLKIVRFSE
jgi:hypothetical protein